MKNNRLIFMIFTLACFVAAGVCLIVDTHMGQNPFSWDTFLTVIAAVAASAALGIIGYMKSKQKYAGKEGI